MSQCAVTISVVIYFCVEIGDNLWNMVVTYVQDSGFVDTGFSVGGPLRFLRGEYSEFSCFCELGFIFVVGLHRQLRTNNIR